MNECDGWEERGRGWTCGMQDGRERRLNRGEKWSLFSTRRSRSTSAQVVAYFHWKLGLPCVYVLYLFGG